MRNLTPKAQTKRVTYTRADRVLLAAVALMECGDFNAYDPDGSKRRALDAACDAARAIRDQAGRTER